MRNCAAVLFCLLPSAVSSISVDAEFSSLLAGSKTKAAQFYLPPREIVKLLTCEVGLNQRNTINLHARAAVPGAGQWFDNFQIRYRAAGEEEHHALSVTTRDSDLPPVRHGASQEKGSPSLPSASTEKVAVSESEMDAVNATAEQEIQRHSALGLLGAGSGASVVALGARAAGVFAPPAVASLTALSVKIDGAAVSTPTSATAGGGAIHVAVAHAAVGHGGQKTESVTATTAGMTVRVQSKDIDKMDVSVVFNDMDAGRCTGPLAEIWGIRPISKRTSRLLSAL